MANWQDHTARATRVAARAFGEPVCLSFFKGGIVDPARPMIAELTAQLHLPEEASGKLGRSSSQFATEVMAGIGLLIIQRADFDGKLMTGDKVRGLNRPGQPWFEILSADTKGTDQIVAQISLTTKPAKD